MTRLIALAAVVAAAIGVVLLAAPSGARGAEPPPCTGWLDPFRPPPSVRVARLVDGVPVVELTAFRSVVERALAADWAADAPAEALEAAAVLVKQAVWYRTMHAHEGYMTPVGGCFDVLEGTDLRLAPTSAVDAAHVAAIEATWSLTVRLPSLADPFLLPFMWAGGDGRCAPSGTSRYPVVEHDAIVACAIEGLTVPEILTRLLGPELVIERVLGLSGPSRYETAVAVSGIAAPTGPVEVVWITTGRDFPDALTAGAAAARHGGVVLLVPGPSIPSAVAEELRRLEPRRIRVAGGPSVVPDAVLAGLRAYSPDVARAFGATRYETAIEISRRSFAPGTDVVFVATGHDYPDALAGASAAAHVGAPVLLVPGGAPTGTLATRLAAELTRLAPSTIHVLGGPAVVEPSTEAWLRSFAPTVDRLAGPDRYATAAAISAATFAAGGERVKIATGRNFPDALVGAAIDGPLLLVPGPGAWPSSPTIDEARRLSARQLTVLGSGFVVSDLAVMAVAGGRQPTDSDRILGPYFCVALPGEPILDADGIPMAVYAGTPRYNPVQVSQWGLMHFERWLRGGDAADRSIFLAMADWLVGRQQPSGLWLYDFAFGGQPVPWWSSMAQGQAVSLLLRAYQETGEGVYLDRSRLALATMRRTHANAGVAMFDKGWYWLEEYMPPYSRHTLNGFIFSIEGLRESHLVTGDPSVGAWTREALGTLKAWLPAFDSGTWSYYNLGASPGSNIPGTRASLRYHVIHVMQLRHVALIGSDPAISSRAARWAAYVVDPPPGVDVGPAASPDEPSLFTSADPLDGS